jgi:hypothetical protein
MAVNVNKTRLRIIEVIFQFPLLFAIYLNSKKARSNKNEDNTLYTTAFFFFYPWSFFRSRNAEIDCHDMVLFF